MPRKTRIVKRRRAAALTLDDLDLVDHLSMLAAWGPPHNDFDRERSRWQRWAEFLDEYRQLRDEVREHYGDRLQGRPLFAERVLGFVEAHGLPALEAIPCYEHLLDALDACDDDGHDPAA